MGWRWSGSASESPSPLLSAAHGGILWGFFPLVPGKPGKGGPKAPGRTPAPSGFAGALWLSVGGRGWSVALRLSFGQSESLQRGGTHPEQREAETELLAPGGKHRGHLRNRAGTPGRRGQP